MTLFGDILRRRRLRKALTEAIVLKVLRNCNFTEEETQWLLVGGLQRPLGDEFAGELFLTNRFRRIKYMHFLAWLIEECGRCLNSQGVVNEQFPNYSTVDIANAVDSLLDYLLNAFRFAFESEHGPGAAGREAIRAFYDLPRDRCGPRTKRNISRIEKDQRLTDFMKRFSTRTS
jgi:hypothetical protein